METTRGFIPGRGSKVKSSEPYTSMTLWKNYVVMACCIAPPSSKADSRLSSPDPR